MAERKRGALRTAGIVLWRALAYFLIWLGLTLLMAGIGIRIFFGRITVSQMLSNLTPETDGGGGPLVWAGVLLVGVLPILLTLLIAWRVAARRRRRRRAAALEGEPQTKREKKDARTRRLPAIASAGLVVLLVVSGGTALGSTVGIVDFIRSNNSPYTIDQYYREPQVVNAAHKHNLVTVYIESGEQTLTDTTRFEKDPFKDLENATPEAEGWKKIDDFQQYHGGGWTMAGITSTQCGVPLKGSGLVSPNEPSDTSDYFGGLTCVGDVLKKQGYTNEFIGGANGSFAGKGTFLKSHGYDTEKDLSTWRAMGESEKDMRSDWGLSDQRLMVRARQEIDHLHAQSEKTGKPFNLSMLTLDSHEPAHIYDYCTVDTKDDVLSMYACSMTQIAGFVDYMKQKGYLEDTAVVITGDHLKHMAPGDHFHEQLDNNPNRSIFNRVWVPGDKKTKLRNGVDQLNLFPTILEASGLKLKDHSAGLGVSALTSTIPKDSAQALSPDKYQELVEARSKKFYDRAWDSSAKKK